MEPARANGASSASARTALAPNAAASRASSTAVAGRAIVQIVARMRSAGHPCAYDQSASGAPPAGIVRRTEGAGERLLDDGLPDIGGQPTPSRCHAAVAGVDDSVRGGSTGDRLLTRAAELDEHWENAAHALRGLPHVIDIRNIGLTAAIELAPVPGKPTVRGMTALHKAFQKGAVIRVTGDTIALAPPLPITPAQIDDLFALVAETIEEVADL